MSAVPHQHQQTSRTREKPQGDEEASTELRLGEFQNVHALTLSEARLVINVVMENRRQKQQRDLQDTELLIKTQDYLDIFARFKEKESIEAVERLLAAHEDLEPFERSQLGSLCCETAEEAKTLIPSLGTKKADPDLQELLDEMMRLRNIAE
ncbi:MAG: RNA polymerase B [Chaenotheca gracillima]|nr:MAG: RNA polymerase B [Chaenotheca gracillima]